METSAFDLTPYKEKLSEKGYELLKILLEHRELQRTKVTAMANRELPNTFFEILGNKIEVLDDAVKHYNAAISSKEIIRIYNFYEQVTKT